MTKLWIEKEPSVVKYNAEMQTVKTRNLVSLKDHVCFVTASIPSMLAFYDTQRFKCLRWKTYVRTQKTYEKSSQT